jgi:hypothetical protein
MFSQTQYKIVYMIYGISFNKFLGNLAASVNIKKKGVFFTKNCFWKTLHYGLDTEPKIRNLNRNK